LSPTCPSIARRFLRTSREFFLPGELEGSEATPVELARQAGYGRGARKTWLDGWTGEARALSCEDGEGVPSAAARWGTTHTLGSDAKKDLLLKATNALRLQMGLRADITPDASRLT
jgi:hypothetical protein